MTIITKAINKGAIPTLTAMVNLFTRLGAAAVDISFKTNSAINTKMPIRANEAASAGIIRDNTVEVVIVEVMIGSFRLYRKALVLNHTEFYPESQSLKVKFARLPQSRHGLDTERKNHGIRLRKT